MSDRRMDLASWLFEIRNAGEPAYMRDWFGRGHQVQARYLGLADRILRAIDSGHPPVDIERRVQEILLEVGWRHPLRDAGRLVDTLSGVSA